MGMTIIQLEAANVIPIAMILINFFCVFSSPRKVAVINFN